MRLLNSVLVVRLVFALLAACTLPLTGPAAAARKTTAVAPFSLPPSVDLFYTVRAKQSGLTISGQSTMQWHANGQKYTVAAETRAMLVGKVLDERSEGMITAGGLAPDSFTEKRFRKDASTTRFDRKGGVISYGASGKTEPLTGGEQDRTSAIWQLIGIARARQMLKPGAAIQFVVAGQHDSDEWVFKVEAKEKLGTALGELDTLRIVRAPPAGKSGQRLDIWLAPGRDWYPVRLRFTEGNGEFIDQMIDSIEKP